MSAVQPLKEVCYAENCIQPAVLVHSNLTGTLREPSDVAMLDLLTCTILPVKGLRHTTKGQDTLYLLTLLESASGNM
jgi:hypothetical protein